MVLRQIASAVALSATLCGVVGCSAEPPEALPAGVELTVHQNRPDTEDRRLQIRVSNGSDTPLTITALSFSSPRFAAAAAYPKAPTLVRAGVVVDLPIALTEPVCDAADLPALVTVSFTRAGVSHTAEVTPGDPLNQLDGISERDCLEHTMDAIAEIRQPDAIRVETVESRLVAFVDLVIVPTRVHESFTLVSIDDTVLFGIFDERSTSPLPTLPLNNEVRGGDDALEISIPLVPARCDPHAVAEDKRGTLMPLRVEVDGVAGIRYLALNDRLKGELYSFVAEACEQSPPLPARSP